MSTQQQEEQQRSGYDPSDTTFRFVTRPDDITLDDDPDSLRAEMSCGHAVTPQSLTAWCRSLLDQGQYKFTCPALKAGTTMEKCGEEWSYTEMRKLAVLTAEEQAHFEETMAMLAAAEYCEFKTCPGCQSFVERQDLTNLSVHCKICTTQTREVYDFCWQCLRRWRGRAPRADKCDSEGCVNQDVERLAKCNLLTLEEVQNVRVPSMRACPTCGNIVEHNGAGCKNIICKRCQIEFCFSCLKLKPDCLITSSYFLPCADGVADRQTSIPSWVK